MSDDEADVAVDETPDDAMSAAERVKAARAVAAVEADGPSVDPNTLAPWERHDDVDEPVSTEQLLAMVAAAQGAATESVIDPATGERRTVTWADAEQAAAARAEGRSLEQSTGGG